MISTFDFSKVISLITARVGQKDFNVTIAIDKLRPLKTATQVQADIYILAIDLKDIFPEYFTQLYPMHCSDIKNNCDLHIERIAEFAEMASGKGKTVIVNNAYYPTHLVSGIYDFQNPFGQLYWIDYINKGLSSLPETFPNVFIFNMQYYLYSYGAQMAIDQRRMYHEAVLFTDGFHEYLADKYSDFIATLSNPRKKCVVTDLDGTLWGGVAGEDDLEELIVGNEYPGNIYRDIQHQLKQYSDQGVLLAICSKNNENDINRVFNDHPGMVLRYDSFSARRINWGDKATNIRSIADELNIGLDSIVFIDDNPFEIEMIRRNLPEVEAIQFTADPIINLNIARDIKSLNYLIYTEEDMSRTKYYKQRTMANEYLKEGLALDDFYRSLNITATIKRPDKIEIPRVAQLTMKTNQFNLTAERYSEAEIAGMMESDNHRLYAMRICDKFGDHGIVGAAIIAMAETSWEIITFLLSCRVIGRSAEKALLSQIQVDAMAHGITRIVGAYVATQRNEIAKDFYSNCGFDNCGGKWILMNDLRRIEPPDWISVLST